MNQCKCGSWAINDDPAEQWCDVCLWVRQADEALAELEVVKVRCAELEALCKSNVSPGTLYWKNELEAEKKRSGELFAELAEVREENARLQAVADAGNALKKAKTPWDKDQTTILLFAALDGKDPDHD